MKEKTPPGEGSPANKEDRPLEDAEPITPHFLRQVEIVLDILKDGQGEKALRIPYFVSRIPYPVSRIPYPVDLEGAQNQPNNNSSCN